MNAASVMQHVNSSHSQWPSCHVASVRVLDKTWLSLSISFSPFAHSVSFSLFLLFLDLGICVCFGSVDC